MYGIITLFATIALAQPYPFAPRHNTFMNVFMVTLPTIMLTLFPPQPRTRVNPKKFWRNTLFPTIPMALISGATVTLTYVYAVSSLHLSYTSAGTISVVVATLLGINMVFRSLQMLAVVMTKSLYLARLLYIGTALVIASISFGFTFTRDFFDFARPSIDQLLRIWPIALLVIAAVTAQIAWAGIIKRRLIKNSPASEANTTPH